MYMRYCISAILPFVNYSTSLQDLIVQSCLCAAEMVAKEVILVRQKLGKLESPNTQENWTTFAQHE